MKIVLVAVVLLTLLSADGFEVHGSLIYDSKTELSWEAKPSSTKMKWKEAVEYCERLELRLPNLYELKSLVDYKKYNPAIRTNLIDIRTDDYYWSSSVYTNDSSRAWRVYFYYGNDYWGNKTRTHYVLCVSGQ